MKSLLIFIAVVFVGVSSARGASRPVSNDFNVGAQGGLSIGYESVSTGTPAGYGYMYGFVGGAFVQYQVFSPIWVGLEGNFSQIGYQVSPGSNVIVNVLEVPLDILAKFSLIPD